MIYHNILLIHESSKSMEKLSRTLEHVGHHVEVVHSAEDALKVIEDTHPEMIIASDDIRQPDVFDLCSTIKSKNGKSPQGSRFLILVRRETLKSRQQAEKSGADAYISEESTLPALVERINNLLKNGESPEASDLSGSIAHSGLIDILQLIEFSAKNGVLSVTSGMRHGEMTFSEGQLVSAKSNEKQKEAAVYEMLSWDEGEFEFHAQTITDAKTRLAPISSLVLEWARVKDEEGRLPDAPPKIEEPQKPDEVAQPLEDETEEEEETHPQNWASRLNAWLGYLREK
ncbi:response regulator [candidate division WOR-3 bacterium]|nr:response regulator [candidate division WOR-3 bacterium]